MLAETDRRGLHETGAATTHTPRGQSVAASGGSARMSSEADGVPSASFDGSAATHLNCSKAPVSAVRGLNSAPWLTSILMTSSMPLVCRIGVVAADADTQGAGRPLCHVVQLAPSTVS